MKKIKKTLALAIALCLVLGLAACGSETNNTTNNATTETSKTSYADAHVILLNDTTATLDGKTIEEFDYTWSISPDSTDETYTGTEPKTDAAAYIAHDIIYYPVLDESGFTAEEYDGETEWVYHYTAEGNTDYIFSCLPYFQGDSSLPTQMMHSAEDAYNNKVLHITQAGDYVLQGTWHGQIWIDLGDSDDTFADENAKVRLILNGADVTCDVAPALVFYSVYECDNTWEDRTEYTNETDLTNAGAKVVIVDGTENNFTGANVYRMLKAKYKKEGSTVQKKRWKMDGAFYSFVSMLIESEEKGTGILNITSTTFEGLDTELHLTINSGYINILTQDDGINVNEDDVSVFTMNGGRLTIFAGQGAEGDVVDSNGYVKVNGGTILGSTPSPADDILDSDKGTETSDNATVINGSGSSGMGGMTGPGGFGGGDFNGQRPEGNGQMPEGFNGQRPDMQNMAPGGFGNMTPPGFTK